MRTIRRDPSWRRLALALGSCAVLACAATADIIPGDRRIDWIGNVGVAGGIPQRTNVRNCVASDGAHADGTDTASQIQACVNNTPTDGVAYLPAGVYTLGSSLTLRGRKTLRGEGRDATVLLAGDLPQAVSFGEQYTPKTAVDIVSGCTKGSTQLALADASTIAVGLHLRVDELNDPAVPVTSVGYGSCTWCGREDGARVRGQFVKVTAKDGNTITISPPLYFTFAAGRQPQVQAPGGPDPSGVTAELAGIEDLTIKNDWRPSKVLGTDGREYGAFRSHTSSSDGSDRPTSGANWQANWTATGAAGSAAPAWQPGTAYDGDYDSARTPVRVTLTSSCWLKNVRIDRCGKRCIELFRDNYRFEIRDSHVARCLNRWDSDNCYGTLIGAYTSGTLIENNILESLADGPMFAWNASGNVVAYNYIYDAHRTMNQRTWFTADGGSHHGAHTSFNLWEGNELESVYFDQYWGSHSHNTLFRNRILGKYMVDGVADESYLQNVNVIATEKDVRYQNYLGNVLGTAGYHTVYERNADGCPNGFSDRKVYRTGYVSSGNCSIPDADPAVFTTMLRHMNFDYVSNSVRLCSEGSEPGCQGGDGSQSLPPSLYLTAKPAWYGPGAWPAFDPLGPTVSDIPAKLRFLGVTSASPPQRLRVVR